MKRWPRSQRSLTIAALGEARRPLSRLGRLGLGCDLLHIFPALTEVGGGHRLAGRPASLQRGSMAGIASPVNVSVRQRVVLERLLVRTRTLAQHLVERCRIVLGSADGRPNLHQAIDRAITAWQCRTQPPNDRTADCARARPRAA